MSYCRFAWDNSDVYVYEGERGFECCGCKLHNSFRSNSELGMIVHLVEHLIAGHTVPEYAFTRLLGDYYSKVKKKPLPKFQIKAQKMYAQALAIMEKEKKRRGKCIS